MSIHSIRNSSHRLFTSDAFISCSTGFRISNWHGCLIRARRDSLRETKTYCNLTPGELQALQQLWRDKFITLKKAGKGTTSVMMSKQSKINEGLALLKEKNNFQSLTQPMVETTTRKATQLIKSLLQEGHIDHIAAKWLSSTPNPPRIPIFYTLTKIHKPTPVGRSEYLHL